MKHIVCDAKHVTDHLLDIERPDGPSLAEERNTHIPAVGNIFHHTGKHSRHFFPQVCIKRFIALLDRLKGGMAVRLPAFCFHIDLFALQLKITVQIGNAANPGRKLLFEAESRNISG